MSDPERFHPVRQARKAFAVNKSFLENAGVVASYSVGSLLFLFLYHFLMARYLGPASYAVIGTFLSILLTGMLVSGSFYLILTRFVAYHHSRSQYEEINYLVSQALRNFFAAGLLLFLCFLIFSEQIAVFFHLPDVRAVVALGFALWLQLLIPVYEAAFKGLEEVHAMGRLRLIESAARWTLSLLFAYFALQLTSMTVALGLGTFVALSASYHGVRKLMNRQTVRPNMNEVRSYAIPVFVTTASLAILLNLDLILVKHYFPGDEAGVFAAASFLAKIPFLISWVLGTVLFPRVTRLFVDGLSTRHLLKNALQWMTLLTVISALFSMLFARPLLRQVFGPEFSLGAYFGVYVLAIGFLSLVNIISIYQLARRRFRLAFIIPWFAALQFILILSFHDSLLQVILISIIVSSLLVITTLVALRHELRLESIFSE